MGATHDGFTIHELEELSGFDRRTIAYYTQEGLLPKVGRRGRGTVYPAAFKERLMFIRAVRNLQDAGSLRAVTLAEIKGLMTSMSTQTILNLKTSADPEEAIRALFHDPDWDTRGIAVTVEAVVEEDSEYRSRRPGTKTIAEKNSSPSRHSYAEARQDTSARTIRQLIHQIDLAADQSEEKSSTSATVITQLAAAKLSEHISITVKGLCDDQGDLLVELIEKLRELP